MASSGVAYDSGLLMLASVLVILAVNAAWKLWVKRRAPSTRQVQLQREPWLARFDTPAPQLLRRRRPTEGPQPKAAHRSSEPVAVPEDLPEIPGTAMGLDLPQPPPEAAGGMSEDVVVLGALQGADEAQDVEEAEQELEPSRSSPEVFDNLVDDLTRQEAEQQELEPSRSSPEVFDDLVDDLTRQEAEQQVPARRSISETLRAASTEEEPTEEIFDQLLEHLEESLMQVELSQHHAVLLKRAELHLLSLLGGLRDLLMRSLRSQARSRMADLVGCARASRLRAVLDSLHLSAGRCTDDRVASCRVACDAVDGVLGDFGLQATLRQVQEEKRLALQQALEQKRLEEAQLQKSRERQQAELRKTQEEQRAALAQALQIRVVDDLEHTSMSAVPKRPVRVVPDFPRGNACLVQWFLDYAEALLSEVLCFLDGLSLTFLELCSTWWRRLVSTNLAGVWRFIHLCALGARPPMSLARPPKGVTRGGGPWKQLWLAHRWLLAEPDGRQRSVAFEQARLLLSPGSHAVVQPMKPSQRFLINIIKNCLDGSSQPDPRFGPLHKRWCSHLMVGAEAMVTHANGVQTNHEQLYMSWSVCFSAMQGLPRLFLASAREAQSAWEVDLAECRLPPKAPLPWAAAAQEIHELRAAGRPLRSGLCDAVELCSFRLQGPQWRAQQVQLAVSEYWQHLHKELFGLERSQTHGRSADRCLQLLLALTCPKPFAQEPQKLALALEGLRPHFE
ncbi:Uncharacterized protein SCF082_LOCUS14877 [Durusdinium trenchii]|uniref:Uncharacterized protein n=1 Tax=Durusdinium trenchii TaxID=1381693 RepID=A0ABP0K132_9DINO